MQLMPAIEKWHMTSFPDPVWRLRWFFVLRGGVRQNSGWSPGTWPSVIEKLIELKDVIETVGIEGEHMETSEIVTFVLCPIKQFEKIEYHGMVSSDGLHMSVAGISIRTKDSARIVVFLNGYIHSEGFRNG